MRFLPLTVLVSARKRRRSAVESGDRSPRCKSSTPPSDVRVVRVRAVDFGAAGGADGGADGGGDDSSIGGGDGAGGGGGPAGVT